MAYLTASIPRFTDGKRSWSLMREFATTLFLLLLSSVLFFLCAEIYSLFLSHNLIRFQCPKRARSNCFLLIKADRRNQFGPIYQASLLFNSRFRFMQNLLAKINLNLSLINYAFSHNLFVRK